MKLALILRNDAEEKNKPTEKFKNRNSTDFGANAPVMVIQM